MFYREKNFIKLNDLLTFTLNLKYLYFEKLSFQIKRQLYYLNLKTYFSYLLKTLNDNNKYNRIV